jgi:hypothetical protein
MVDYPVRNVRRVVWASQYLIMQILLTTRLPDRRRLWSGSPVADKAAKIGLWLTAVIPE